jgi:hypothetical protein
MLFRNAPIAHSKGSMPDIGYPQPISDWMDVLEGNCEHGIHVDKNTAVTKWCGEKMDYGLAVEVLLHKDKRAKHVSA